MSAKKRPTAATTKMENASTNLGHFTVNATLATGSRLTGKLATVSEIEHVLSLLHALVLRCFSGFVYHITSSSSLSLSSILLSRDYRPQHLVNTSTEFEFE